MVLRIAQSDEQSFVQMTVGRLWWKLVPSLLRWAGPAMSFLHRHGWILLGAAMCVVVVFGAWGFYGHLATREPRPTVSEVLYLSLQLFSLGSGATIPGAVAWRLEVARFLGAFVMVAAAARALVMFFYDRFQLFVLSLFGHDHVVVCGLGRVGSRLVDELRKRGEWIVIVESDSANEGLKRAREQGTTIVLGDSTDEFTLRKVAIHRAKALIAVIGEDGANVETAILARRLNVSRRAGRLRCIIHVADRKLRSMLANSRLTVDPDDDFELQYFDVFEICARVMLRESQFLPAVMPSTNRNRHLLVIGFGRLGEALVLRAVRDARIDRPGISPAFSVTVIDQHADEKQARFERLHPHVAEVCALKFVQMELHQPEFEAGQFLTNVRGVPDVSAVYVCLGDDSLGMLAALTMEKLLAGSGVPVIVRLSEEAGFAAALATARSIGPAQDTIRAIGLLELSCNVDLVLDGAHELLARGIHQGYVLHHLELGETVAENKSLVMWEELAEPFRASNRDRARSIGNHLDAIGYRMVQVLTEEPTILKLSETEVEILAQLEHERWCSEKRAQSSSPSASPFPALHARRWEDCPNEVKAFNRQMVAVMPSILAKADFEVRRREGQHE